MSKYAFGVDVGGTTVKLGLFNDEGQVLDKWEIPTVKDNGGEKVLPDIAASIKNKMQENADKHNQKQKACSAAFMLFGTFSDIFHIQHHTVLNAVDAFMFCTVVHECTLDILHPGDQQHISHKQCQLHKCFHDRYHKLGSSYFPAQAGKRIGKKHKRCNRHNNGNCYCYI